MQYAGQQCIHTAEYQAEQQIHEKQVTAIGLLRLPSLVTNKAILYAPSAFTIRGRLFSLPRPYRFSDYVLAKQRPEITNRVDVP